MAGWIASSLIEIVYFILIVLIVRQKKKFQVSTNLIHTRGTIWIRSVLILVIAEGFQIPSMMMVSTGAFVLVTIVRVTINSIVGVGVVAVNTELGSFALVFFSGVLFVFSKYLNNIDIERLLFYET